MEIISGLEYPKPYQDYITVDPDTCQISSDKEYLKGYVKKLFISLFGVEPEECFWCYGYESAYAGPVPEPRKP